MLFSDLSRILKLKLAERLGIRLASINSDEIPEASLKVNDISVEMIGPMSFKVYVRVKLFKNRDALTTFVLYSDNTVFDCNLLMVIFLGYRDLFELSLSDCFEQRSFVLKPSEEYLFPSVSKERLYPFSTPTHKASTCLMDWLKKRMEIPFTLVNAHSTRKGFFISNFSNYIQVAPYSSMRKLFNMIMSRSGWNSRACWTYGRSPLMDAQLLRNVYIENVKKAMEAGLSKPDPMQFVPTVTTVASHPVEFETSEEFKQFMDQELARRKDIGNKYSKFCEYIKGLGVKNLNSVTAKCLKEMEAFNNHSSSRQCSSKMRQKCIRQWRVKKCVVDNSRNIYKKEEVSFYQLDMLAIANDPLLTLCRVYDKTRAEYDHPDYWCTDCQMFIAKNMVPKLKSTKTIKGVKKRCYRCIHVKDGSDNLCEDKMVDRRFIKLVFKDSEEDILKCGCKRGKCLKFDSCSILHRWLLLQELVTKKTNVLIKKC